MTVEKFLKDRPALKILRIEKDLGIYPGIISHRIKYNIPIPKGHVKKLEKYLEKYGYKNTVNDDEESCVVLDLKPSQEESINIETLDTSNTKLIHIEGEFSMYEDGGIRMRDKKSKLWHKWGGNNNIKLNKPFKIFIKYII